MGPYFRRKTLKKVASTTDPNGVVDKMRENFINRAEEAVLSEAAASIYEDPLLGPIMDSGDVKTAARLAENRISDAATLDKLASMDHDDIERLATEGLRRRLVEKAAKLEPEKPSITSLIGIGG